jgi:hypothetical protein
VVKAGKPKIPVALTEYNIFATGSGQQVSHINGMHAVLVTGEAIKTGYGAALRWDLANGWDNGNDHGMFSYGNEPGIEKYAPRPAFFHLYYLQKYTGNVLLGSTVNGENLVVIPTAFSSGEVSVAIVNTGEKNQTVRLNVENFKFGERYFVYTLTGTPNTNFSRKLFINGNGNALEAGGPAGYGSIKANSSIIADEIKIKAPPLSVTYVLVEKGTKELVVNEKIVGFNTITEDDRIRIFPNPSGGYFQITGIPEGIDNLKIFNDAGQIVYSEMLDGNHYQSDKSEILISGIYYIHLQGRNNVIIKKLIII